MKLGVQQRGLALLLSTIMFSCVLVPGQVEAIGERKRSPENRTPSPGDWACVEKHAPYYSYQIPVLFQDASSGTPKLIGWGYADTCVASDSRVGDGYASIMEVHDFWHPDFQQRVGAIQDLVRIAELLPEVESIRKNGYDLPIPNFTAESARAVYLDPDWVLAQEGKDEDEKVCSRNVCPGIPPELGEILTAAGFLSTTDTQGHRRWLIYSSRGIVARRGTAAVAFFNARGHNDFYVHRPAFEIEGGGGIARVMLNPVDLSLREIPPSVLVAPDGTARIPALVVNESVHQHRTSLVWRYRGEALWRPAESYRWRYQGESTWRPGNTPIELPAGTARFGEDMDPGVAPIEVLLQDVQPGLEVELRINPDPDNPRPAEVAFNENSDPKGDAYANNFGFTLLQGVAPNLTALDIWYSPTPVYPGDRVGLSVAVRSDSSTGWTEPVDAEVVWYVDGKAVGTTPVPGLKPGEERRANLPAAFTAPDAPRVVVRAVVTPVDKETNIPDNTAEREIPIQKPDLTISLQGPEMILADDHQMKVVVQVRNAGKRTLEPKVTLSLNGSVVWSDVVPVPADGQASRLVTVPLSALGSSVTLTGVVDPGNAIAESNEGNNQATLTIPVRSEPPPADLEAWLIGG